MTQMPEAGRQAAHVLVDAVVAFDADHDDSGDAMSLALRRINEVGAVKATFDDETDVLEVDASDLLGGAVVALHWLASLAAELGKTSRETVLAELREYLDTDQA